MIARTQAAACISNLKQLQTVLFSYAADHNNCLPAAYANGVAWPSVVKDYLPAPADKNALVRPLFVTFCPAMAKW